MGRLLIKIAQKGWLRLEEKSFLTRLLMLWHIWKYGLFSTLRQCSPAPYRAIWALLSGQDRYAFYIPKRPHIQELSLNPLGLSALLWLLKAGYAILSANADSGGLSIAITDNLNLQVRGIEDFGLLNEVLVEKVYGSAFPAYRILDIGAYVGETSLFFAAFGAEKVIAAEPAPDNYALAKQNIQNSPYAERIELLPVAIADVNGEMELDPTQTNPRTRAFIPTSARESSQGSGKIPVWSFARLIQHSGWEEIDLVKMDCEGAEVPILLHTPAEVLQKVRQWVIEYHGDPQPIETRLRKLGYQVKRFKELVDAGLIRAERT